MPANDDGREAVVRILAEMFAQDMTIPFGDQVEMDKALILAEIAVRFAEALALEERRPWAADESDRRDWDYQDYLEKNPIMERPLPWAKALAAMKERSE